MKKGISYFIVRTIIFFTLPLLRSSLFLSLRRRRSVSVSVWRRCVSGASAIRTFGWGGGTRVWNSVLQYHSVPPPSARSLESLAHSLTHSLTHSLAHSLARSLTHSRTTQPAPPWPFPVLGLVRLDVVVRVDDRHRVEHLLLLELGAVLLLNAILVEVAAPVEQRRLDVLLLCLCCTARSSARSQRNRRTSFSLMDGAVGTVAAAAPRAGGWCPRLRRARRGTWYLPIDRYIFIHRTRTRTHTHTHAHRCDERMNEWVYSQQVTR